MSGTLGVVYWYLMMLCGVLVLLPNTVADADSTVRRWVDLGWTASKRLRNWDPRRINLAYFWSLLVYVGLGVLILLFLSQPKGLVEIYGCIANFALGFSCWHVLYVNLRILPREVAPGWLNRAALGAAGGYFFALAVITFGIELKKLGWIS